MDADLAVRVSGSDKRMSQGRLLLSPAPKVMHPTGKMEPNAPLSDFDASGTDFLGFVWGGIDRAWMIPRVRQATANG